MIPDVLLVEFLLCYIKTYSLTPGKVQWPLMMKKKLYSESNLPQRRKSLAHGNKRVKFYPPLHVSPFWISLKGYLISTTSVPSVTKHWSLVNL